MAEIMHPSLPENFLSPEVSCILIHRDYDVLQSVKLHSSELKIADSFKSKSRKESFLLGRKAALLALMKLGVVAPVLKGSSDEPIWPEGVVGSIAHSGEFAICAVSKKKEVIGLGIDIECGSKVDLRIAKRICSPKELENLQGDEREKLEKLFNIFSAKEAYYKAVFPTFKKYLGFRDVELTWNGTEFRGEIINSNFGSKEPAIGKIGRGSCLTSICYKLR